MQNNYANTGASEFFFRNRDIWVSTLKWRAKQTANNETREHAKREKKIRFRCIRNCNPTSILFRVCGWSFTRAFALYKSTPRTSSGRNTCKMTHTNTYIQGISKCERFNNTSENCMRIDNHRIEIRDAFICSSSFLRFFTGWSFALLCCCCCCCSIPFSFRVAELYFLSKQSSPDVDAHVVALCRIFVYFACSCWISHTRCASANDDGINIHLITTIFYSRSFTFSCQAKPDQT